jgi:hypothetical protein
MTAVPKELWGVQPEGFYAPTIEDIVADESADLLAFVDPGLDLDPDAPEGQVLGIRARQYALAWEALQVIHDSNNPDNAEDDLLDDICKLSGTARPGATSTTVVVQCALTSGTTLANGTAFAHLTGKPDVQLTPTADFIATSDGTFPVTFACVDTGPISIPVNSLQISAPISGWSAIASSAAGVTGHDVFDDTQLRLLRETELARTGSATVLALQSAIAALPAVISVTVLENDGQVTDGNGLPPHTIAPIVYANGFLDTTALAAVIWEKAAGISTYGTTPITFVDTLGATRTVLYTPVTPVPMTLVYNLATTTGYIGATAVSAAIAAALTLVATPGSTVRVLKCEALALALGGVVDVNSFTLNGGTSNVAVGPFAIATFDLADISVTP